MRFGFFSAKKDDSPFSKNPLFSSASGQALAGFGVAGHYHQLSASAALLNQQQHQKQGDPTAATVNSPAPTSIGGSHLFPMSPAYNLGPSSRKEAASTTASPGLSKNDRKLSLTQVRRN